MKIFSRLLKGKRIKTKKGEIIFTDRNKVDDELLDVIEKAPVISMEELEARCSS